jgi:poly-gamma-glutamate synthesis protein (capsule biosynthesis protein)
VVNLETALTAGGVPWPEKEIHYRMHPRNLPCLAAARIDCCVLANNHVADWGIAGLVETVAALDEAGIRHAGAGRNLAEAEAPAIIEVGAGRRLLVFGFGSQTSGIPADWAATPDRPGVNLLESRGEDPIGRLAARIDATRRAGDVVVASIHWGGNWGYRIPRAQRELAHRLVDAARVDLVHGHSSHHVKAIEVYRERLILYGAGDLLTDYEGINGHEAFRGDLGLMYFADLDPGTGRLLSLQMVPTQVRRFRVVRAARTDARWLAGLLSREGAPFRTRVDVTADGDLALRWEPPALPSTTYRSGD